MSLAAPAERRSALGPLQFPAFRRFWIASLASNFGGMMQTVAAAWLMGTISSGAEMVAFVQTAATLPMMLFAIVAGALADIVDRRKLMLIAQTGMALTAAALAIVTIANLVSPPILLAATFLIAAGTGLYGPAWQASVVEQVSREWLEEAASLNSVGFNIARSLGPAVGGLLVAIAGSGLVFGLNALSYVGLIAAALAWRRPIPKPVLPPERLPEAIATGVRFVSLSPALLAVLVRGSAFAFCGSCLWALPAVLAKDFLGGGPSTYGFLLGGFGGGAIVGAIIRAQVPMSRTTLVRGCSLLFGAAAIALGIMPAVPLAIALMAVAGLAWVMVLTSLSVSVQIIAPRWVVGRAIAINQMAIFAGMALGSTIWGLVARYASVQVAFQVSGAAMIATLLLARRFSLPTAVDPDLTPARSEPLDPLDGPIEPGAGPVVIMIEYRVKAANADAFVQAMAELSRVRRRDGALRWSLQQVLDEPERWVERFHSTNWLAHLRRQIRPTLADESVRERVAQLRVGDVRVTRLIERSRG